MVNAIAREIGKLENAKTNENYGLSKPIQEYD